MAEVWSMKIPSVDRLDAEAQFELPQLFVHLHHAYATQYEIESRTFSDEEFDDAYISWGCRQRGFGRAAEAVKGLGSVRAHASGFKQSFTIGPFTIRPYRFGATRPGNIHLQRLDPNSLTKELLGVGDTTQLQEAFDLRRALNPPPSGRTPHAALMSTCSRSTATHMRVPPGSSSARRSASCSTAPSGSGSWSRPCRRGHDRPHRFRPTVAAGQRDRVRRGDGARSADAPAAR